MNTFKGGGSQRGGLKFGGKKKSVKNKYQSGGRRPETHSKDTSGQLFSATCSECQKQCDVPFRPSNDKPVYCSACFGMKKSGHESRNNEQRNHSTEKRSFQKDRQNYARHNNEQRPEHNRNDAGIADLKRQMNGLEKKLNKILDLINPPMPSPKVPVTKKSETKTVEKPKETKPAEKKVEKRVTKTVAKKVTKKVAAKKTVAKKVTKKTTAKKAG